MTSAIVIDDDEDTVRLFSEFLEEEGISVVGQGYDGKSAVSLYEEKRPDVTFVDIMMPNGSGLYAIRQIQKIEPNAKLIAVTADMSLSTEEKLVELNVPLVTKPFEMSKIMQLVRS